MAQSFDDLPSADPSAALDGGSAIHNSVLIRTHEPKGARHPWTAPALLGAAVLIAAAVVGFVATHPSGPLDNHSVGATPTAATAFTTG